MVSVYTRRGAAAERINATGITVAAPDTRTARDIKASSDPGIVSGAGLLFVCSKSYDTLEIMRQIAPFAQKGSSVVIVQNGIIEHRAITALRPDLALFFGIISFGAFVTGTGAVERSGPAEMTVVPAPGSFMKFPFDSGIIPGLPLFCRTDTLQVIWHKLCLNCAINPVTSIYRITNGELIGHPEAFELACRASREAFSVGLKSSIFQSVPDAAAELTGLCKRTGSNRSSMLVDVLNRRRTEIDAINGYIVRKADRIGLEAPVNRSLIEAVNRL